jgi:hypothetical protein
MKLAMWNSPFIRALGLVSLGYLVFQAIAWALRSFFRMTQGLGYWVQTSLLHHGWQIAIAIGVLYLLYTAVTTSRNRY